MGKIGVWELVIVLVIILILFGVGKLPEVMKSMGKGLREFKKSSSGEDEAAPPAAKKEEKK